MLRVLFVCSQNKLRSLAAEHVFASYPGIECVSAGTNIDAETHCQPNWSRGRKPLSRWRRKIASTSRPNFKRTLPKNASCVSTYRTTTPSPETELVGGFLRRAKRGFSRVSAPWPEHECQMFSRFGHPNSSGNEFKMTKIFPLQAHLVSYQRVTIRLKWERAGGLI